jgi:hypothetical protein
MATGKAAAPAAASGDNPGPQGQGAGWMEATTVDVAQLVESRVVIPVVVGSSPIVHPTNKMGR